MPNNIRPELDVIRTPRPPRNPRQPRPSFTVSDQIQVSLDPELAKQLGEFILGHGDDNPAIVALGHQLDHVIED